MNRGLTVHFDYTELMKLRELNSLSVEARPDNSRPVRTTVVLSGQQSSCPDNSRPVRTKVVLSGWQFMYQICCLTTLITNGKKRP